MALIDAVLDFVDRFSVAAAYPAYGQGEWMSKVIEAIALHMADSSGGQNSWTAALDCYEGKTSLPLMTIHKSKGLEYHTVIFLGLDDDAWWNFSSAAAEETSGFFVAFSRAKQRVLFTYCASRGARHKIAALYRLPAGSRSWYGKKISKIPPTPTRRAPARRRAPLRRFRGLAKRR